jgi:hypothetical protein
MNKTKLLADMYDELDYIARNYDQLKKQEQTTKTLEVLLREISAYVVYFNDILDYRPRKRNTKLVSTEHTIYRPRTFDHYVKMDMSHTIKLKNCKTYDVTPYKLYATVTKSKNNNDLDVVQQFHTCMLDFICCLTPSERKPDIDISFLVSLSHPWCNHVYYECLLAGKLNISLSVIYVAHFLLYPCTIESSHQLQELELNLDTSGSKYPLSTIIEECNIINEFAHMVFSFDRTDCSEDTPVKLDKVTRDNLNRLDISEFDRAKLTTCCTSIHAIIHRFNAHNKTDFEPGRFLLYFISDQYLQFARTKIVGYLRRRLICEKYTDVFLYVTYENIENYLYYSFMNTLHSPVERIRTTLLESFDVSDDNNDARVVPKQEYYYFNPTDIISSTIFFSCYDVYNIYTLMAGLCAVSTRMDVDGDDRRMEYIFNRKNPLFSNFLVMLPFIRLYSFQDVPTTALSCMVHNFIHVVYMILESPEYTKTYASYMLRCMLNEDFQHKNRKFRTNVAPYGRWHARFIPVLLQLIPLVTCHLQKKKK